MCFTQANPPVNEQWIVNLPWLFAYSQTGGVSCLVIGTHDKGWKSIFPVKGLVFHLSGSDSGDFFTRSSGGCYIHRTNDLILNFLNFRGNCLQSLEDILVIFILQPFFSKGIRNTHDYAGVAFFND